MDARLQAQVADPTAPPQSAVPQAVGLAGLASLLTAFPLVVLWNPADKGAALLVLMLSLAVPMIALEVLLNRHKLLSRPLAPANPPRVAVKLCGTVATLGVLALAYWNFPIYRNEQAIVLLALLKYTWLPLLILTPLYIWLTDRLIEQPEDGLYMAGLAALGQWKDVDRPALAQHALGWLVKGFFLPLMLWNSWGNLDLLFDSPLEAVRSPPYGWYVFAYDMIFFVDVLFASVGYLCTLRLLDLHIRWAENTVLGWLVCLVCYAPFWGTIARHYLPYSEGDHGWGYWFGSATSLGSVWALLILLVLGAHVWATVIFGIRFSNLTHRGIITNGPYRWSKHPAYITKMILYTLIWLPFLNPVSWTGALSATLMFGCLCYIYYLRAKAEEAYLMRDPTYQAYAKYIEHNGLVAVARRALQKTMSGAA